MSLPSFFNVTVPVDQSSVKPQAPYKPRGSAELREHILGNFETVFPRIIQSVYAGSTLSAAVKALPSFPGFHIDPGMFNRWIMKDATRRALYEEAQEYRAEVWADHMIAIAEGQSNDTIERDKFKNDTYKFLMSRQSRKRYGDTKVVDVTHTISIAAALQQSKQRVIEAMVVDGDLPDDDDEVRALIAGSEDEGDDDDD